MALSTYASDLELASYMHRVLGNTATVLDLSPANGDYDEAVSDAVAAYGADDVSSISGRDNLRKLRALARREVWRAVRDSTAAHYRFAADNQTFDRQQIHEHAADMFRQAEIDCYEFGVNYAAEVDRVHFVHDPYAFVEDQDRTRP